MLYRELDRDKKARDRENAFNIEGVRLCEEAIKAGVTAVQAFVTETALKKYPETAENLRKICDPVIITDDLGSYISDTRSPQGIFITAEKLDKKENSCTIYNGRYILLDGLQDTGNIGTIIRTCEALGTDGMILSPDCADIYSPKVVRGSMGSLFRLPIIISELTAVIPEMKKNGCEVYSAVLDKNAESINDVSFPQNCAVIIGNEGNGVSPEVIKAAGKSVYIPIENAESLNAAIAAAIFCNEMRRNINKGNL